MFELWIATYCAMYASFGNYCPKATYQVFKSSTEAVEFLTRKETEEFWLYPVRFPVAEEWHGKINYTPSVTTQIREPNK